MSPSTLAYRDTLTQRLRFLREQIGLSQRELADALDVSQNVVFRSEDQIRLSVEAFLSLFLFYVDKHDLNPDWLFSLDNEAIPMHASAARVDREKARLVDSFYQQIQENPLIS